MPDARLAGALFAVCLLCSGCGADARQVAAAETGGNPAAGQAAVARYGCGSCHTVPGVEGARGLVGPPLSGLGKRYYVAGELPNTPETLSGWIRHPHSVNPKTLMPELGVTEKDANDIAAYLYSLT